MSRILQIVWTLAAATPPCPLLHCSRCGCQRGVVSSGKFRLNANGKKLDAWLVYRCGVCGDSFNRVVFERRARAGIEPALIEALHRNDPELARRIACDLAGAGRWANGFEAAGDIAIARRALPPVPQEADRLAIRVAAASHAALRADRLIAQGLGLSRGAVGALALSGRLAVDGGGKALSRPLRDGAVVRLDLSGRGDRREIVGRAAGEEAD